MQPTQNQPTLNSTTNGVNVNQRVFVQRDYRLGVAIRFVTDFPHELDGRVISKLPRAINNYTLLPNQLMNLLICNLLLKM